MPLTNGTSIPRMDLNGSVREVQDIMGFIAGRIAPEVEVGAPTGRYGYMSAGEFFRKFTGVRAADGSYQRSTWRMDDAGFLTVEYGHEETLDDRQAAIYRSYADFERTRADRLLMVMKIMREIRVAALVQNTTTWALSGNTGLDISGSLPWSTQATSLPINDVAAAQVAARKQAGFLLRTGICTIKTWWDLSLSTQVREALKYTAPVNSFIPLSTLAGVLNLDEIIVPDCMYNNVNDATPAATPSLVDIWSDSYFSLVRTAKSASIEEPCVARSFVYKQDGGGGADDPNMFEYVDDKVRGTVLRARHELQEKVVTTGCGFLIKVRV